MNAHLKSAEANQRTKRSLSDTDHATPSTAPAQAVGPQLVASPTRTPNRYSASLTPQMRQRIADECRVRGCVQTAKAYNVTFGLCLELRIEALDRLVSETRERLAAMERKAA